MTRNDWLERLKNTDKESIAHRLINEFLADTDEVSTVWISVDDKLPVAPIGRVHVMVEEEFIGQGMPRKPIKMLRMGDYSSEFCQPGESGYWEDDYGNRIEVTDEGGVDVNRVTHWARQIPGPNNNEI